MIEIFGYRITPEGIEKGETQGEGTQELGSGSGSQERGAEDNPTPNLEANPAFAPLPHRFPPQPASPLLPLTPSLTVKPFVLIWVLALFLPMALA
ncbi:MAG: hypothetical protein SFU83_20600 [Meiothermus sp.]|nr:hypothetical protein [Meiothermus sp.]